MDEIGVRIDKDLRPAYYDDFHCIMGACRYNCCDDSWKIKFSKQDYLKVKQAPKSPELEEMTRKGIRRLRGQAQNDSYAEFLNNGEKRCAFHTPEGLCRLQLECGEKTLPKVCRTFPRVEGYMSSGYLERSLSPACEGVLALLWDLPEGVDFRSDPLPKAQQRLFTPDEGNLLPLWFPVVREWCVDLLQDRRFTLPQRIFLMGMGLKELADGEEDIERWLARAAVLPGSVDVSNIPPAGEAELTMCLITCIRTLLGVYLGSTDRNAVWRELLEALEEEHHGDTNGVAVSIDSYQAAQARYEERFAGQDHFMENLMVTIFFHLSMPQMASREELWKGYVNFCNLYAFYRFVSVMSCREGAAGDRDELFRLIVLASRSLIHNSKRRSQLRDEFFQNDSATLAHMAILLCG